MIKAVKDYYEKQSNIPSVYLQDIDMTCSEEDKASFCYLDDVKNRIRDFVRAKKNLYIYSSNVGNGKTTWATKILRAYIDSCSDFILVDESNNEILPAYFISVPALINLRKKSISNDKANNKLQIELHNIATAKVVAFDDIATKSATDFDAEFLFTIIDDRVTAQKTCIYTSNIAPDKLSAVIGARLADRTAFSSICKELKGGSNRHCDESF